MNWSSDSSARKEMSFHFLPAITAEPNSRREVELRQSSARSHLAKSMHRRKQASKKLPPDQADIELHRASEGMAIVEGRTKRNDRHLLLTSGQLSMCVIPDRIVDPHTKMLLHYCTQSFWPGFEIGSAAFHIPPFALDYNTLVAQGPALVHACLWQAAVNLAFKRNSRVTDKQSLLHYNQAIVHISKDITKPVAEIPEQTLYAILSLCGPEMSPDDGNGITKKAFDPPLAELSWIHVFVSRLLIDSHAKALMNLVDLKGGIHNVKYAGFQASFNYMDLVRATQKLVKPQLPVSQLYGRVKETHDRTKFFGYASDFVEHSPFGESSATLNRLIVIGLEEDVREVICDMRVWVKVIEAYHHNALTNPDLSLLAAHRDLIQQRLLATLPDGYDGKKPVQRDASRSPETTADHWINEILQTALLIFSLGVTCPISYAPPYHYAAQRLQAQLILYKERAVYLGLSDLLIWLGMLGILCTEQVGSGLREWFVGFLDRVEQKRRVAEGARDWDEVRKESLEPILWSYVACDTAAERAWRDVRGVVDETSWTWGRTTWSTMLGTICG
ncbi:uncharacterized protein FSUBG_3342 [Fusarium subglutinans]|uniref:Uncharacterized protein n=1 Tax=Gibberella subglutinans TaxID=42677 RepID=A0A8H5Q763_GIBSU|nr:uncharacterized protein FSUBG_3342 [Fusarium subglutinans]KAF5610110.1 hypothetical protein FSUBG_3342 [Fusarium subglutinans]